MWCCCSVCFCVLSLYTYTKNQISTIMERNKAKKFWHRTCQGIWSVNKRERDRDWEREREEEICYCRILRAVTSKWCNGRLKITSSLITFSSSVSMCRPQSIILRSNSSLHYYSLVAMSRKNHNNRNHNRNKVNTREESDLIKVKIANNEPHSAIKQVLNLLCQHRQRNFLTKTNKTINKFNNNNNKNFSLCILFLVFYFNKFLLIFFFSVPFLSKAVHISFLSFDAMRWTVSCSVYLLRMLTPPHLFDFIEP